MNEILRDFIAGEQSAYQDFGPDQDYFPQRVERFLSGRVPGVFERRVTDLLEYYGGIRETRKVAWGQEVSATISSDLRAEWANMQSPIKLDLSQFPKKWVNGGWVLDIGKIPADSGV